MITLSINFHLYGDWSTTASVSLVIPFSYSWAVKYNRQKINKLNLCIRFNFHILLLAHQMHKKLTFCYSNKHFATGITKKAEIFVSRDFNTRQLLHRVEFSTIDWKTIRKRWRNVRNITWTPPPSHSIVLQLFIFLLLYVRIILVPELSLN